MNLTFVEAAHFTRRIQEMGLESALRDLQTVLIANPASGDLDPGTGGLRKARIPDVTRGKGKRGGARVHYLHLPHIGVVYLLFVYGKDELTTLSPPQKRQLKQVVNAIRTEWETR